MACLSFWWKLFSVVLLLTTIQCEPNVVLDKTTCAGLPGEYIDIGETATCKCELTYTDYDTRVRWYTEDGTVIGKQDPSGQFSILTVSYNDLGTNPTYVCRTINRRTSFYYVVKYQPKFASYSNVTLPKVVIDGKNCPGIYGEYIASGKTVTCKCELKFTDFETRARWYKKDGSVMGSEDSSGQSSILRVSYNASDANATYECRTYNPRSKRYHFLRYHPIFSTPSSGGETHILRSETIGGILAGVVVLAVIIIVLRKWRSHKRQNAATTLIVLSRPTVGIKV